MRYLKLYGSKLILTMIEFITLLFLLTILYYFDLIHQETYSLFKLLILLGCISFNSFQLGSMVSNKGYKEGLRFGFIMITFLLIMSLFFTKIQLKSILYYILILASAVLGSTIGMSQKKKK